MMKRTVMMMVLDDDVVDVHEVDKRYVAYNSSKQNELFCLICHNCMICLSMLSLFLSCSLARSINLSVSFI